MEFDFGLLSFYITGILIVLLGGVLVYVIREGRKIVELGLDKFSENSPAIYDIIVKIVRSGVLDAEFQWLKGVVTDKKEYALAYIKTVMEKYGLSKYFNLDEISAQIEIIVYDEFNKARKNYKPK